MKSRITLSIFHALLSIGLFAQAPQGIQYQAVVRNGNGDPLLNTPVQFRFTIEHSSGAPVYYQETQSTISNAMGGINLVIGAGNATQGNFETTHWKNGDLQVRIELDPTGSQNFAAFGTTLLQSVPYALYSDRAGALVDDNGNDWTPENDSDAQTLTVNGNQLSISNGNAVVLPTGSGGDNWGTQTIVTEPELTGNGTLASPLGITTQGASNGDVLKWNGNAWVPETDNGQNYTQGEGIDISGGVITNTGDNDNDADNEIQTLSINGNNVSLSNGGGTIALPTLSEGTGIDISGNTISATNTQAIWNANQLQSRNVASNAPTAGQVLKYDGTNWAPGTDNGGSYTEGTGINIAGNVIAAENTVALWNANKLQGFSIATSTPTGGNVLKFNPDNDQWFPGADDDSNPWGDIGDNIFYNDGNVGIGTNTPDTKLHLVGGDFTIEDEYMGKFGTNSFEFSTHMVPTADNNRSVGISTRRWTVIWAVNGTIQTSDSHDKEQITSLHYGLADVMKLKPVTFLWKDQPEMGTKIGLLAQEVEAVIPEVVVSKDRNPGLFPEDTGETGDKRGMLYSDLIPVLIKSIQEQQAMIEELKAEVEELKSKQ